MFWEFPFYQKVEMGWAFGESVRSGGEGVDFKSIAGSRIGGAYADGDERIHGINFAADLIEDGPLSPAVHEGHRHVRDVLQDGAMNAEGRLEIPGNEVDLLFDRLNEFVSNWTAADSATKYEGAAAHGIGAPPRLRVMPSRCCHFVVKFMAGYFLDDLLHGYIS